MLRSSSPCRGGGIARFQAYPPHERATAARRAVESGIQFPDLREDPGAERVPYIGTIVGWNRIADLGRLKQPALIINGQHDVLTPACGMRMQRALPNAEIKIFANSSHSPFYEEPEAYRAALLDFLGRQRGRAWGGGGYGIN